MSIRIYALAKQLKVESKYLVDVCKKIGIDGKGSALASLTEQEAEKVKESLQQESQTAKPGFVSDAATLPLQRPSLVAPTGKVPVLKPTHIPTKPLRNLSDEHQTDEDKVEEKEFDEDSLHEPHREEVADVTSSVPEVAPEIKEKPDSVISKPQDDSDAAPVAPPVEPQKPAPVATEKVEVKTPAVTPAAVEVGVQTPASTVQTQQTAPAQRPEMVRGPVRPILDSRVPSLDGKRRKPGDISPVVPQRPTDAAKTKEQHPKQGHHQSQKPAAPAIRLAPLPKQATKPVKTESGPAPQKPDQKLPKDAIRAAQMGASRPL
ncbi:MAG: translation initiation factor IF-2 N-terminal domain-containing protein, partial [Thermoguttaceae bacterium]